MDRLSHLIVWGQDFRSRGPISSFDFHVLYLPKNRTNHLIPHHTSCWVWKPGSRKSWLRQELEWKLTPVSRTERETSKPLEKLLVDGWGGSGGIGSVVSAAAQRMQFEPLSALCTASVLPTPHRVASPYNCLLLQSKASFPSTDVWAY